MMIFLPRLRVANIFCIAFLFCMNLAFGQASTRELSTANPETLGFSSARLDRMDEVFQAYSDNDKMAGSVILVARKGKVAYFKAFGQRDISAGAPMEKDAIFRIASQTKAIISVGIMLLQEEGKLLIQDPLSKYIPEFGETTVAVPQEDGTYQVVPAERPITLRDLLTHTAGVSYGYGPASDVWQEAGIQGWYFADRSEPILATVKRMAALPMDTQPGKQWVYGYSLDILGAVIEQASGMALDEFLQDRIFDPLGMTDTQFYLPENQADRLATVYTPREGAALQPAPQEGTMDAQGAYVKGPRQSFSGGAGLLSTARDYYLFLQMLANGGELNGHRIVSSRTVDLMTVNHLDDEVDFRPGERFGLGFYVVVDPGERGIPGSTGEFGWGGAYGSAYWVDPAEELVVVYFTQLRPASIVEDHLMLRALVYQALVD